MTKYTAILHLLVLAHSAMLGNAACTIVNNRFVGQDKGIVLPVALTYDITVKAGTTRKDVESTILPSIEKAFATKSAERLIVACAPAGTDTSKFSNIVGMNLNPKDSIARVCSTSKANCYIVDSQVTLYTKSSNIGAAEAYLSAIEELLSSKGGLTNETIVSLGNVKSVKVKSTPGLRSDNKFASIGILLGVAVVLILIIVGVCYCLYLKLMNKVIAKGMENYKK
jgi:hypothetical protein